MNRAPEVIEVTPEETASKVTLEGLFATHVADSLALSLELCETLVDMLEGASSDALPQARQLRSMIEASIAVADALADAHP